VRYGTQWDHWGSGGNAVRFGIPSLPETHLGHHFRSIDGAMNMRTVRITFDAEFPDTATLQEIEDSVAFELRSGALLSGANSLINFEMVANKIVSVREF